jgi:hypothetical protein
MRIVGNSVAAIVSSSIFRKLSCSSNSTKTLNASRSETSSLQAAGHPAADDLLDLVDHFEVDDQNDVEEMVSAAFKKAQPKFHKKFRFDSEGDAFCATSSDRSNLRSAVSKVAAKFRGASSTGRFQRVRERAPVTVCTSSTARTIATICSSANSRPIGQLRPSLGATFASMTRRTGWPWTFSRGK